MIEEHKTHYTCKRYCNHLARDIVVEQIKQSEMMIVRCKYNHLDNTCYVHFDPNNSHDILSFEPTSCPLGVEKIVQVVND